MKINILNEIRNVLDVQSNSLRDLKVHVDRTYIDVVKAILKCRGKVVCTGIGKSGLVAQKMAATFASTGTPAIFLHPSEGLHGNLGMVSKKDIVLAIGKSGESEEILNLLPSIRKIGARLISITAKKDSSLAKQSAIVLFTPIKREVCPLNLAPTTSTTIAMVVGDALAVTLMKLRGFDSEDFALYHPGGLLGKQLLLRVSDVMRSGKNNPLVSIKAPLKTLLSEITQKWTGSASVVDARGRFKGLVTDFDLRPLISHPDKIAKASIEKVMNKRPTFVYADEMAIKALRLMEDRKKPFSVLPVLDRKHRAVGMLHIHDLLTRGLVQLDGKPGS